MVRSYRINEFLSRMAEVYGTACVSVQGRGIGRASSFRTDGVLVGFGNGSVVLFGYERIVRVDCPPGRSL